MMPNNSTDIHALTLAEVNRQIQVHSERRRQIVEERAAIFASTQKNGGAIESPIVDADERAAREHAKSLLNGSAPPSLSLPPEITSDKRLYREQRGIEIVLKVLTDKELVARATGAVAWAENNGDRWKALCREITLTAIKLNALETSARELIGQCGDVFAIRLPMVNLIVGQSIHEMSIGELIGIALNEEIVTQAEVRKAKNVE
jgi:hypothetical protein